MTHETGPQPNQFADLEKTLNSLPDDECLREVRNLIKILKESTRATDLQILTAFLQKRQAKHLAAAEGLVSTRTELDRGVKLVAFLEAYIRQRFPQ